MFLYAVGILLFYAFAFSFEYILAVELFLGVSGQAWNICALVGFQLVVPHEMRGRVLSMVLTLAQLGFVGGRTRGTALADAVGDQLAVGIFGAIPTTLLAAPAPLRLADAAQADGGRSACPARRGRVSLSPASTAVTAEASPRITRVPSVFSTQTSQMDALLRALRATSSRIFAWARTVSSTQSTLVSLTDIRPPSSQPIPKWSCMTCETKQVDIMPWTTMFGKPSFFASSRSV